MANSIATVEAKKALVVNCFQISNFVLWQTATFKVNSEIFML